MPRGISDEVGELFEQNGGAGRFWQEVGQMLDHKLAQGCAELAQAINSQADGFTPYGVGQSPLEVEGPATSYTDMLREASQREVPEQSQEIER